MSKHKPKLTNISDKINELLAPKELHDPEYNSDDDTVAKTRHYESEDEQQPAAELSHIRKKNVRMLQDIDAKYRGKISSRKDVNKIDCVSSEYEESSESETETGGFSNKLKELDSEDEIDANDVHDRDSEDNIQKSDAEEEDSGQEDEADDSSKSKETSSFDEDESDFDGGDILSHKEDSNDDSDEASVEIPNNDDESNKRISEDVQKGVSIQNQQHIWEKLLEIRIQSQKLLLKANSLPLTEHFQQLESDSGFDEEVHKTTNNVENLLSKMCSLQKVLVNQNPEMKQVSEKRKRNDYGDETDKIFKFSKKLESDFVDYKDYRNATISKWYDRTKVLAPGAKNSKQPTFDIIRNIQGAMSRKEELIKKSQLLRDGYKIIGFKTEVTKERLGDSSEQNTESEPIHCNEIYDDSEFYHAQLRELIEAKTNTSNSIDMSKQFAELQKLRNKIKKVVDTRASKGRKIRYAVHNKMINFMARNDPSDWTDEAKTELFSSLFGSRT